MNEELLLNLISTLVTVLFGWGIVTTMTLRENRSALEREQRYGERLREQLEEMKNKYVLIEEEVDEYRDEDADNTAKIKRLEIDLKSAKEALRFISEVASERPKPTSPPTWPPTTDNEE